MKKLLLAITVIGSLTVMSCGGGNNEPATPITAEQFETLRENKDNDGKRFSITGYPYLDNDVTIHNDMDVLVSFFAQPKGEGDNVADINLNYKDKKNGVYVPESFTPDDLQIFDNEGNSLGINDKVTVSFTMKLDTKRAPREGGKRLVKDENGIPRPVETGPEYYGAGPVDIIIEKAQ